MKRITGALLLSMLLFLLVFSMVLGLTTNASAADTSKMNDLLNKKVAIFRSVNKKASRNLVNAAQDKAFTDYFKTKDPAEKKVLKKKIQEISLAVQKKFKVDEMCLIANNGKELTRIVFNDIAPDSDLSPDESGAPFYEPSFKKKHRQIHIEAPYLSADSKRWVIAYTTPIVLEDGNKPAFLHYEIPLSFYIGEMSKGVQGEDEYIVVVGNDGLVYSDSRRKYKLDGDPEADLKPSDFFPAFDDGSSPEVNGILASMKEGKTGSDSFTHGGNNYAIVYKSLGYFDWSLAVVSRN